VTGTGNSLLSFPETGVELSLESSVYSCASSDYGAISRARAISYLEVESIVRSSVGINVYSTAKSLVLSAVWSSVRSAVWRAMR
jgi:hypothetical protein